MVSINAYTVGGEGREKKEKLFPEGGGVFFPVTGHFIPNSIDCQLFNGYNVVTDGYSAVTGSAKVLRKM